MILPKITLELKACVEKQTSYHTKYLPLCSLQLHDATHEAPKNHHEDVSNTSDDDAVAPTHPSQTHIPFPAVGWKTSLVCRTLLSEAFMNHSAASVTQQLFLNPHHRSASPIRLVPPLLRYNPYVCVRQKWTEMWGCDNRRRCEKRNKKKTDRKCPDHRTGHRKLVMVLPDRLL